MAAQLLASKVVILEEEPRIRNVPALPTAVLGIVGLTERGPVGKATLVTSFEEFTDTFGGFTQNGVLTLSIQGFFQNGGSIAWVTRTVHYTDITSAASKTSTAATTGDILDRAGTPLATLRIDAKTDGTFGNDLRIKIDPPTSGDTDKFNLLVEEDGLIVETFPNLSMTDADPRFVETVINNLDTGSNRITATDLDSATASPNDLPALGFTSFMTGGADGLASLADVDFLGDPAGENGLRAFDQIQNINIITIPDRPTAAVHNGMLTFCEVTRDKSCFAILDPPANLDATGIITHVETTAAILGLSEFGAIYWPQVKILNPSTTVFGNVSDLTVPPSGHIAGTYSRIDNSRPGGVFIPPAGIENGRLFGVIGFETDEVLDEAKRDLVFPKRINPLTVFPGTPRHIDGARTLKGNGNFPTVAERRGVIFIEQTLKLGTLFAKNQNNTETLRGALARTITAFLLTQMRNNAFRSKNPNTAFFVDFSEALNPPSVVFSGQVIGRIGLATNKPAEFIILRFSQDTRAIEEELAA